MNKVNLIGNLTKDPVLRYTKQNTAVASYSIAINNKYGEKQETDFINIVTWGKSAEFVSQYIKKGQAIAITGRLKNNSYEDDKGNKHNLIVVVTEEIESLGSKKEQSKEEKVEQTKIEEPKEEKYELYSQFDLEDEDLPF